MAEGNGIMWLRGLPRICFSEWLHEHERFTKEPALMNKNLVKWSVNQERLARTTSVGVECHLGVTLVPNGTVVNTEEFECRTSFDVKHAILQDYTETYASSVESTKRLQIFCCHCCVRS